VVRATKNPLRPRNKFLTRPDAVSGEYRGKIISRKEFFAREFFCAAFCGITNLFLLGSCQLPLQLLQLQRV
jgi:hypothetical protein